MKIILITCLVFVSANLFAKSGSIGSVTSLAAKQWIHGSKDCKKNDDPAMEVYQYDKGSYILRQNKCLSFEAPFIYVLIGNNKTLVLDTGATEDDKVFPLYETIKQLQDKHTSSKNYETLVIHSHSHSDHYAGDEQFSGKDNTVVVGTEKGDFEKFFSFDEQPNQTVTIDLGERAVTILATPGHQEQAITIYDSQTKWLLTGDSFYPGVVYVKEWDEYRNSISKLSSFVNSHEVSAILGAHIEMKKEPGEYYDIGTIYQPNEASLPLFANDLLELNKVLQESDDEEKIVQKSLIVEPLPAVAKVLSSIFSIF